jgi:hypothetical protein
MIQVDRRADISGVTGKRLLRHFPLNPNGKYDRGALQMFLKNAPTASAAKSLD